MHLLPLFALLNSLAAFAASNYQCSVEYGETVPLALLVLKSGAACPNCDNSNVEIPAGSLDTKRSRFWNGPVRRNPRISSKVKRLRLSAGNEAPIYLETRYATQIGEPFSLQISCPKDAEVGEAKCAGSLESPTVIRQATLLNQWIPGATGGASFTLTNREYLNLLGRIERSNSNETVSSSGELKFFREDPLYIFDFGVDDRFSWALGKEQRLAAFEVKLRCMKQ